MNEIEAILDDCLRRMTVEGYGVEQCLARYPGHEAQLRPLLEASALLNVINAVTPSQTYRRVGRAKLMAHVEAYRQQTPRAFQPAWRIAVAAAAIVVVMLLSTTAFSQAALPGEPLYAWKLSSEDVWRAVSPDPVDVDLTLADRRATELTKVAHDARGEWQARDGFHEVLTRLESEKNAENGPKIDQALKAHQKRLSDAGIQDEQLDDLVRGKKH